MNLEIMENRKKNILENINYAKESNINKVSAVLVSENKEVEKELLSWLLLEGYKVSLRKDEVSILTIEW